MKGPMHKNSQDRIDKIEALLPKQKPKSFTDELGEAVKDPRTVKDRSLAPYELWMGKYYDEIERANGLEAKLIHSEAKLKIAVEALEDASWFINRFNLYANQGKIYLPDEFNHRVFNYREALKQINGEDEE